MVGVKDGGPQAGVLAFHATEDDLRQHDYRQQTVASVEHALRLIETREGEGWELVNLFPKPAGRGIVGRDFDVVVIIRRARDGSPSHPPDSTERRS